MRTIEKLGTVTFHRARELVTPPAPIRAFGPEEVEQAGFKIGSVVPPIQFSETELKRAQELGQYLIRRAARTADKTPITMKRIHTERKNVLGNGKLLYEVDWYKGEEFFTTDTPNDGWRLVSREVIPGSASLDYIGQTQAIADYLVNEVYKGGELPDEYQTVVDEFKSCKAKLERLRDTDWEKCAEKCASLKLNQLFRDTPVEVLYDMVVQHEINREYLLPNMYHWTPRRSSDGSLVNLGHCDHDGVDVYDYVPWYSSSLLGVRFSRSAVPNSVS